MTHRTATQARYLVGIDLGTTHTAVAYVDTAGADAAVRLFEIEQLVAPGEVAPRPLLPSLRYHPAPGELAPADAALPWLEPDLGEDLPFAVIGELARDLGAKVPGRLVASAKSWLSHPAVDRSADILPWGADPEIGRISPLAASAGYLAHVRSAWNHRFPEHPLEDQDVVLTVPASFDEGARSLTVEAAYRAGLPVHLIEEPQAACYDWLRRHHENLNEALGDTRLLLVVDVGGGTTDLTLIQVAHGEHGPKLTRIGVGDHLMLGGDNMDLSLARIAEERIGEAKLGAGALSQLMQQCRAAKERLLAPAAPEKTTITLLGAGARLIGGARSAAFGRDEVRSLILDGFFKRVPVDEKPLGRRGAIVEFGLPYAADPTITRHLAAFLAKHESACREALGEPIPDAVLLNGGVFRSEALGERLLQILADWRGAPLKVLHNAEPELAVARGAVAYGLARRGQGLRIGGGSARSFFMLIEGEKAEKTAVCLLPRATEEGHEVRLSDPTFLLRLGQPARFHLLSSTSDAAFTPGQLVNVDDDSFTPLPPVAAVLKTEAGQAGEARVALASMLSEIGTLQVGCIALDKPDRRWNLEFQLRGGEAGQVITSAKAHPRFDEAVERIERIYGSRSREVQPREVKTLRSDLEKILGKRDGWDTALSRELFAVLWEGAKRRRSPDHERVWLNLTGFCLRPGLGYPLDDWRVQQLWSIYEHGIQYVKEAQIWSEWWTLWRRVAGGLDPRAQSRLLDDLAYELQPPSDKQQKRKGARKQGYDDMVRLVGGLEHLPAQKKVEVGTWLIKRLSGKGESPQTWWAIGRLGARAPFYGSAHHVVPPAVAVEWLEPLFLVDWKAVQPAPFAAAMLARMSGDRERDLEPALRARVVERLKAAKAAETWIRMVEEVVELDEADEKRVFGESLPAGLRLERENSH